MAYIQFFLPLLHWTTQEITTYTSKAMEMLWKNKASKAAFILMKMEYICSLGKVEDWMCLTFTIILSLERCHCCLHLLDRNSLGQKCSHTCVKLCRSIPKASGKWISGSSWFVNSWGKYQAAPLHRHLFKIEKKSYPMSNGILSTPMPTL